MDYVFAFNAFEACLWTVIGIFCAVTSHRTPARRFHLRAMSVLFVLFAASEACEMRTGAWWRPLGLLFWKAACIVLLSVMAFQHWCWTKSEAGCSELSMNFENSRTDTAEVVGSFPETTNASADNREMKSD